MSGEFGLVPFNFEARIEELEAALAASEAARRQAEEESAARGACLRALRARLPQPTLDDLCDWQRDQIDAVLARPEPPAENDRETLGRIVREEWLAWQRAKPNPKPENLRTWEELDEGAREIEMRMAEAVATHVLGGPPADGLREAAKRAMNVVGWDIDENAESPKVFCRGCARFRDEPHEEWCAVAALRAALAAAPVAPADGLRRAVDRLLSFMPNPADPEVYQGDGERTVPWVFPVAAMLAMGDVIDALAAAPVAEGRGAGDAE